MPRVKLLSHSSALLPSALCVVVSLCVGHESSAQNASMPKIGEIAGGNVVLLESRTVKKAGDEITATLRTVFAKPTKAPGGEWFGSRTLVTVRCKAGTAAVKENRYYSDAKFNKIASEKIVGIPGYGAPVPGSVTAVAHKHLCATKP
ncbi:MAG: hypothetical protein IBJ03_16200 [Gemmatimonadaceae bacterium]|nr:hypothetical protein [Gemmatimonadaceae bacterium]